MVRVSEEAAKGEKKEFRGYLMPRFGSFWLYKSTSLYLQATHSQSMKSDMVSTNLHFLFVEKFFS